MKKRLGEILVERGLIDADQLNSALAHQRQWGMRLGTALVAKGFIAEGTLTRVLSESLSIPMVDLARVVVDPRALHAVPRKLCEQHDVFPLSLREQPNGRRLLLLAMADPLNATVIDEIAFSTDAIVKPAIAQISSLEQAIRRHYHGQHVDIAPLTFERPAAGAGDTEQMTITVGGSERTIDARGEIFPLTDEVQEQFPAEIAADLADYRGHPTGVFQIGAANAALPMATSAYTTEGVAINDGDILSSQGAEHDAMEALEKKFWALMRVLARRGMITKEEFLRELRAGDE